MVLLNFRCHCLEAFSKRNIQSVVVLDLSNTSECMAVSPGRHILIQKLFLISLKAVVLLNIHSVTTLSKVLQEFNNVSLHVPQVLPDLAVSSCMRVGSEEVVEHDTKQFDSLNIDNAVSFSVANQLPDHVDLFIDYILPGVARPFKLMSTSFTFILVLFLGEN